MQIAFFKLRFAALFVIIAFSLQALAQSSPPTVQERLGYPANSRLLIIHADDLGMAHTVNRAIFEALENGWVTSASIMVPCPWFPEVARWAHDHPQADLGIHLVLDSEWNEYRWAPISGPGKVPSLLDKDGYFPNDPELLSDVKLSEVETELHAQVDKAQAAGIHLSHLDSHMIALVSSQELFGVYQKVGRDYNLPILMVKEGGFRVPPGGNPPASQPWVQQVISIDTGVPEREWLNWYKKALTPLQPGLYELIVHLAHDNDEIQGFTQNHPDWGAAWRQSDFDTMRSPEFRQFLKDQGFILTSWSQVSKAMQAAR